jgi:hypothetical protein
MAISRDDVVPTAQTMQQWQYLMRENLTEEQLTLLGRQGWRLVGPPTPRAFNGTTSKFIYVFERPG